MAESRKKPRRFGGVVKGVLLSAGAACAGLLTALWLGSGSLSTSQQSIFLCLVSLAMLGLLLGGLVWAGSGVAARAILGGLLGGLSAAVNVALVLAVFDYAVTGDLRVALRNRPLVTLAAPAGAVVGLALGFVVAAIATLITRRAARLRAMQVQAGDQPTDASLAPSPLRRLLAWSMVAAVGAALAVPISHELRRRYAVLALRAGGGELAISRYGHVGWRSWLKEVDMIWEDEVPLYSLEVVESIALSENAGDVELALAARLNETRSLSLAHSRITDAGMEHLSAFASLEFLSLSHTGITDEGLRHIATLTSLNVLHATGTEISDEGLRHLSGLTALGELELSETRIVGSGLTHLAPLQSLQFLYLCRTRLTEPGLAEVGKLPGLWILNLAGAEFDESAFRELVQFGGAATPMSPLIDLTGSNVRDEWLPHLAGLGNARISLSMRNTDVSPDAVGALRKSLPRASIVATPRTAPGGPRGRH